MKWPITLSGNRHDRWLVEQANAEQPEELTAEHVAFLEKLDPCYRERHAGSLAPGELLCADLSCSHLLASWPLLMQSGSPNPGDYLA